MKLFYIALILPLLVGLQACTFKSTPAADKSESDSNTVSKEPPTRRIDADIRLSKINLEDAQDTILIVEEAPDLEMIKRNKNFGYTEAEIQQYFLQAIELKYDFSGFDPNSVKAAPAAGVHPRVFFGPEELPILRKNLSETLPGQKIMASIKKEIQNNLFKEGSETAKGYQQLLEGDQSAPIHKNISIPYGALYEAFRCLIEDDDEGGKQVAKAITTIAQIDQAVIQQAIDQYKAKNPDAERYDFRVTAKHPSQNGALGLMYDWAYQWMDESQRTIIRQAIVTASANMTLQGSQTLRTPRASSSNWISWTSRLVCLLTAIEGEPGYDAESYKRTVQSMKWFFSLSVFPEGESMEGWGKQFLMAELSYIMARRGETFFANENVRNIFRKYWLHAMNPWGRGDQQYGPYDGPFTFYDSQGGTNTKVPSLPDILVYKKLFPTDHHIDFVYRTAVGENYEGFGGRANFRHHFSTYDGFCKAIFASLFDASQTYDEAHASITKDQPFTYFCMDTGTMITRSAWSKDALYLQYLSRSMPGGHKYSDRGHFNLYALGRHWGIYAKMRQVKEAYWPMNRSGVMVDGEGVSIAPGKCVAYKDSPLVSFTASDLKITYDYISNYVMPPKGKDKGKKVMLPYSYNDFRLEPSERPSWNLTPDMRPHWYDSRKLPYDNRMGGSNSAGWRKRDIPYEKAFRTAGMVRGKHSYVLIIDDIKKDDQLRDYEWGMTLATDVTLHKAVGNDAILSEEGVSDEDSRTLLVRMLSAENLQGPARIKQVASKNPPQKDTVIPKLVFNSQSNEPRFVSLIYAMRAGEPAPQTKWNHDQSSLEIKWEDQTDILLFQKLDNGRTIIQVKRDGQIIGGITK